MKRIVLVITLSICASVFAAAPRIDTVPLHHFYQPKFDFHFYTATPSDVPIIKADPNWRYLGIVGHVFPKKTPETVALMRLRKDEFGGVNHLYTVTLAEANHAINTAGWREEGFAGYIAETQIRGSVPLYRLYKPCELPSDGKFRSVDRCEDAIGGDVHVYTTVEADKNSALANGYHLVRIEGYIWPEPASYPPPPRILPGEKKDTVQIPVNLTLKNRTENASAVNYDLAVTNVSSFPKEWFTPLNVLPPDRCWGKAASNARLFLEIAWGTGAKADRRGDCRPLNSPADLQAFRFSLDGKDGLARNVQVIVRDRLTDVRHTSNVFPVGAFGIDDVLVPAGCKHFLGRAGEYLCTNATAMAACENLSKQGKPIVCRATKPQ